MAEKLGRTPSGGVVLVEREVGKDKWVFDELFDEPTKDFPERVIEETESRLPLIFEAAKSGKGYELTIERDNAGKARKLTYNLTDGKKVILEDTNGNCIADKITESN